MDNFSHAFEVILIVDLGFQIRWHLHSSLSIIAKWVILGPMVQHDRVNHIYVDHGHFLILYILQTQLGPSVKRRRMIPATGLIQSLLISNLTTV